MLAAKFLIKYLYFDKYHNWVINVIFACSVSITLKIAQSITSKHQLVVTIQYRTHLHEHKFQNYFFSICSPTPITI